MREHFKRLSAKIAYLSPIGIANPQPSHPHFPLEFRPAYPTVPLPHMCNSNSKILSTLILFHVLPHFSGLGVGVSNVLIQ